MVFLAVRACTHVFFENAPEDGGGPLHIRWVRVLYGIWFVKLLKFVS